LARDIDASNTRHLRFSLDLIVHAKRGRGTAKGAHYRKFSARKSTALLRFIALQDGIDLPRNLVDFRHAVNRVRGCLWR